MGSIPSPLSYSSGIQGQVLTRVSALTEQRHGSLAGLRWGDSSGIGPASSNLVRTADTTAFSLLLLTEQDTYTSVSHMCIEYLLCTRYCLRAGDMMVNKRVPAFWEVWASGEDGLQ